MGSACGCCLPESDAKERFSNPSISTTNPLTLIDGYQYEPLVSLEEALRHFDGKIDHLSDHIKHAKTKCHYPSEHGLTRDESAAIYIYTMKWEPKCLYKHLQDAWDSGERSPLKPWFKYLKLFRNGLDKLPNAKSEVWQGIAYNEDIKKKLSSTSMYSSMGSCLTSEHEMKDYLHKNNKNNNNAKTILIGYESVNGQDVTGYTASKDSKEVMLWPGAKVYVANVHEGSNKGSLVYHLKQKSDPPPLPTASPPPPPPPPAKTPVIKPVDTIKHFVCPSRNCTNRCRGNHETHHCYGFAFISHTCQHHCGPKLVCFGCAEQHSDLRECSKCESRYCEKCCLK